jgi:hypothetical protein
VRVLSLAVAAKIPSIYHGGGDGALRGVLTFHSVSPLR